MHARSIRIHPAWLGGALLGLFLALALNAASAQQQDESAWRGQRWEYRVFRMNAVDYEDKADYQQILKENDKDPTKADAAFQEHVLNWLGEQGWELIGIERRHANQLHYYLKRPLVR